MVRIFNIIHKDNKISCNYEPEKSGKYGYVEIDTESMEIAKLTYSDYEYGKKMYVAQVRNKIEEAFRKNELTDEMYAVFF